jgi:hypothetical protein
MIIDATARCDIIHRVWSPPPRPSTCPKIVDFGQGLIVTASGAGRLVCAGDTVLDPQAELLPYNAATAIGSFECVSRITGMTCADLQTHHGFTIAIQSYKTF